MSEFGILRAITDDDLSLMLSWRNAPAVRMNMYTQHEISAAEHLAWWEKTKCRDDRKYFMYEFLGKPMGIAAFTEINFENRNSSWSFYASPTAQKGSGSRMEYLMLEYAFNVLSLHKLCCEVLAFNTAVIGLHKKFSFQVEGILREQHKVNDRFVDVYRLGILSSEWRDSRLQIFEKLTHKARHD